MDDSQYMMFSNNEPENEDFNENKTKNQTENPKESATENPTEKLAGSSTENPTENPTEKLAENPVSELSRSVENSHFSTDFSTLNGKRVFVVDAYGLVYQVFHALPEMKGKDGELVNAVFGFVRDLFLILEHQNPDLLFCAFDLHAPTFRAKMYEPYKATREKMPAELIEQIPRIREILDVMKIPVLALEGFEADDILATAAAQTEEKGGECVLVTSDKDSRQLITEHVKIFSLRRNLYLDRAFLIEDWGIAPEQVVDYQALVGDSSDNVPGIPLIGPKAAKELLARFGNLDEILKPENLDAFFGSKPSKKKENLLNGTEMARLCKKLVRLEAHVPIEINWAAGDVWNFDFMHVEPIFVQYGFRKMCEKLPLMRTLFTNSNGSSNSAIFNNSTNSTDSMDSAVSSAQMQNKTQDEKSDTDFCTILNAVVDRHSIPVFSGTFDGKLSAPQLILPPMLFAGGNSGSIFREGSEQGDLFGMFLEAENSGSNADSSTNSNALLTFLEQHRAALADPGIVKVGFDLKKVRNVLRRSGFELAGPLFDVMIAAYILNPLGKHDSFQDLYETFTEAHCGTDAGPTTDTVPVTAAAQTSFLRNLVPFLSQKLRESRLESVCFGLEFPLTEVLAEMEYWGIFVRRERLAEISKRFEGLLSALRARLYELAGVEAPTDAKGESLNLNSPIQLRKILFEKLCLPILHKTKTGPSTDAKTLEELASQHEFPAKLLEYRQLMKFQGTYVEALPKLISADDGRIHTSFNQAVTATGRLSSSDPNLQNIPVRSEEGKVIRSAFVPQNAGWKFVSADYSQIELRVLAHYCGDENLCEAFRRDEDIHTRVASQIHHIPLEEVTKEMRRAAKTVNFGVIYGQSAFGLAAQLKIDQHEAQSFIQKYFEQFPSIQRFLTSVLDFARENGFVATLFGRRRSIEGIRPIQKGQLNLSERTAINTVIQGSAADLIKLAMLKVYARLKREKLRSRLLLQIHDELLLECPPEEIETVQHLLDAEMTNAWTLRVPLKADSEVSTSWE